MTSGDIPHRKQCRRYDNFGDSHCLTFSCFQRRPFLRSERARSWLGDTILTAKTKHPFDLWAYVIMPEHVHLVIWPHEQTRISSVLKAIKLPVTRRALNWVSSRAPGFLARMEDRQPNGKVSHRFWQRGGGYDRNLRTERDVHEKIDYIHANPLRRGPVVDLADWRWSSWHAYNGGTDLPIPVDVGSCPVLRR